MQRRPSGFSLVELVIAMALALLVLLLVSHAFTVMNRSATQTRQLAQLQQNGQLVLNLLGNELQNSGFWGGQAQHSLANANSTSLAPSNDCVETSLDSGSFPVPNAPFITLYAATANGGRQLSCLTNLLPGSEFLQLKRSIGEQVSPDKLRTNRFYWQPDWHQGRFVDVNSVDANQALVFPYQHLVLYVQQQVHQGQRIPVLMRKRLIRTAEGAASISADSVIDGVERLHFEFLIDSTLDGKPNLSLATAEMTPALWLQQQSRIVAVQYHVLLRSLEPDRNYTNTRQYQLGSVTFTAPADHYRRLQLSGAVYFENAVLANN